jgi:hypothetical protein
VATNVLRVQFVQQREPSSPEQTAYEILSTNAVFEALSAWRVFRPWDEAKVEPWEAAVLIFSNTTARSENSVRLIEEIIKYCTSLEANKERFALYLPQIFSILHCLRWSVSEKNSRSAHQESWEKLDQYSKTLEYRYTTNKENFEGDSGAEYEVQPPKPEEGVKPNDISTSQALEKLSAEGMSAEARQRVEAEIRYAQKPLWNVPREEQLSDLRGLTAIEHLRTVWADEIKRWRNKVYLRSVRLRDPDLAEAVSKYATTRKLRDLDRGAAKGLTMVKGFEPSEVEPGRPKRKPPYSRRAALTR